MKSHAVRTYKSSEHLARKDQLAWKIAEVASDPVAVQPDVIEMIGNRIIDNAAVAAASLMTTSRSTPRSSRPSFRKQCRSGRRLTELYSLRKPETLRFCGSRSARS